MGAWTSTCGSSGDLQTGAHHTVEDTAIVLGQALDARARRPRRDRPLRLGAWCRWTRRGPSCAIDISGRPFTLFEAALPPGSTGGFEHELTEEFFRAVATAAKLTVHLRVRGRHQRPPHDRGGLQGVRARAARRGRARPHRDGRAEHEGDAHRVSGYFPRGQVQASQERRERGVLGAGTRATEDAARRRR